MILVQVSVTGRKSLGSLHIHNIGGDTTHARYECFFYEGDGSEGLRFQISHERAAGWGPLVMACIDRLDTKLKPGEKDTVKWP